MGTEQSFAEGEAANNEVVHSPPSSMKIKNLWSFASIVPYAFMAECLIKCRSNFTFNYLLFLEKERDIYTEEEKRLGSQTI
jgi:hypothetical protein